MNGLQPHQVEIINEAEDLRQKIEASEMISIQDRIENNFRYHAPKGIQPQQYEAIRADCKQLALVLARLCPESRELSLAMTKLEEVNMWANAAIARNE